MGTDDQFESIMSVEEPVHPAHLSSGPIPPDSMVPPADVDEQLDGELAREASRRQNASAGVLKRLKLPGSHRPTH